MHTILREYIYPDCIKFYQAGEGSLVGIANTKWMNDLIVEALAQQGYQIVNVKPKGA